MTTRDEKSDWETKLRDYMNAIPICGWSEDREKIITFLKHNYHILDNNETWYDEKFVNELYSRIQEISQLPENKNE